MLNQKTSIVTQCLLIKLSRKKLMLPIIKQLKNFIKYIYLNNLAKKYYTRAII